MVCEAARLKLLLPGSHLFSHTRSRELMGQDGQHFCKEPPGALGEEIRCFKASQPAQAHRSVMGLADACRWWEYAAGDPQMTSVGTLSLLSKSSVT